ncbi:MAG TPA: TonB-dependent receptor plug domain-containing protein, partial [Bacteroidia bacterium]|nr:TonB-dependent receptor plug domain-containing protein [Bacteroidia bacterium]
MKQLLLHVNALIFFLLVSPLLVFAQQDSASTPPDSATMANMTLEQLLKLKESGVSSELEAVLNSKMDVASKKALSLRKSPSVVTLITKEEIEKSGARDLIDVLRLVPGIDFAVDVQGNVSIGMRGNWAEEGKVLLLLDGQEMNELMYSSLQFGNHFDVSQIKRIEIIRGPGSAIYGGFAEYGVISIITKDGEDLNGVTATAGYGQTSRALGYRDISLSIGDKMKDFSYSLAGLFGQANRSDNVYTDLYGNSYTMTGNSNLDPFNINVGIKYKGLSFRGIYDNYQTTTQDNYRTILTQAYPNNFLSELAELKYDYKLNDKITLTPLLSYKSQKPWNFTGTTSLADSLYTAYNRTATQYRGSLTMLYDITRRINIVAGTEVYYNKATIAAPDTQTFNNGTNSLHYTNTAGFIQVLFRYQIASLTLGARFDNNSIYGSSFVPRLGIVKKIETWDFKFLYANSFRAPGIENINLSLDGNIKPEDTRVIEFEAGKEITPSMFCTVNFFDITTKNTIVYYIDTVLSPTGSYEGYKNMPEQGTRGAEFDYRIKNTWGFLDFNYSFYTTAGKTVVPAFQTPGDN